MLTPREGSQPVAILAFLFVACWRLGNGQRVAPSITLSKTSGSTTSRILLPFMLPAVAGIFQRYIAA